MSKVNVVNRKTKKFKSIKREKIKYILPTLKSEPITNLGKYTLLLYGRKKIGKTTLASHFPEALFLMFEPGGKALRIYQEQMTSWKKFVRFIDLIIKDESFKTIVIDTADYAYEECSEYVCWNLGIKHPSEAAWGKGWSAVKKEFNTQVKRLLHSGKGVIFISHQREEEIEERSGRKYHRKTNTLPGQARESMEGLVDIWVNYDYEGKCRILTILGNDYIDVGHRLEENFKYVDGSRVRKISMGNSSYEAYQNFLSAFNNKLIKKEDENEKVNSRIRIKKKGAFVLKKRK